MRSKNVAHLATVRFVLKCKLSSLTSFGSKIVKTSHFFGSCTVFAHAGIFKFQFVRTLIP